MVGSPQVQQNLAIVVFPKCCWLVGHHDHPFDNAANVALRYHGSSNTRFYEKCRYSLMLYIEL